MTVQTHEGLSGNRRTPNPDYRKWLILGVFVVIVVSVTLTALTTTLLYVYPHADITDMLINSPTDVCPGDVINFEFRLYISGKSDITLFSTTQKEIAPRGYQSLYTTETLFRVDEETDFVVVRDYMIPPFYVDPRTERRIPWTPGDYHVQLRVFPTGSNTRDDEDGFNFTIKSDCPPLGES